MRISQFLNPSVCLVGHFVFLQAAFAQTLTEQKVEEKKSGISSVVKTSYVRSAADFDSAYYQSIFTASVIFGYELPDSARLSLKTGVSRDLDALEERNVWSSTSISYASREFEVGPQLIFQYSGAAVLPTNSDARAFLSYRGSLAFGSGLVRTWNTIPLIKSLSLGVTGDGARNFFEYDATIAGRPNNLLDISSGVDTALAINDTFSLSAAYGLKKAKKSNGIWVDTSYEHRIAAGVNLNEQLSVSLSEGTQNRAYSYDAQTLKFALYDYQTTVYEAAATYTF